MVSIVVCRLLSDTSQGLGDDFAVPEEGMVEVTLTEVHTRHLKTTTVFFSERVGLGCPFSLRVFCVCFGCVVPRLFGAHSASRWEPETSG